LVNVLIFCFNCGQNLSIIVVFVVILECLVFSRKNLISKFRVSDSAYTLRLMAPVPPLPDTLSPWGTSVPAAIDYTSGEKGILHPVDVSTVS